MQTEHIKISSDGTGMDEALNLTDSVAETLGLAKKESFRLRLLAEELLGMVRAVAGNIDADFWIREDNRKCALHVASEKVSLNYAARSELLSVSTKGKNTAGLGIMEKIRNIIEAGLYSLEEGLNIQNEYGSGVFLYGSVGVLDVGLEQAVYAWSMQKYKSDVESVRAENPDEWDELEKSIIANIADDVSVGVRKGNFEIIVSKQF
ncbi:MAG: hypothetical protein IJU31_04990 [Synergistaceae bacterium]|nr:hypothetical protein [Synergistaceae bacterium]